MTSLTERLRSIQAGLEPMPDPSTQGDARSRLEALEDAQRAVVELEVDLKASRAATMREYVKEVGSATKAAEALGLSRARIYQIMGKEA
jgi:hypothetical protein